MHRQGGTRTGGIDKESKENSRKRSKGAGIFRKAISKPMRNRTSNTRLQKWIRQGYPLMGSTPELIGDIEGKLFPVPVGRAKWGGKRSGKNTIGRISSEPTKSRKTVTKRGAQQHCKREKQKDQLGPQRRNRGGENPMKGIQFTQLTCYSSRSDGGGVNVLGGGKGFMANLPGGGKEEFWGYTGEKTEY